MLVLKQLPGSMSSQSNISIATRITTFFVGVGNYIGSGLSLKMLKP